jgi:FAD/FMN-containing dehydrogenase
MNAVAELQAIAGAKTVLGPDEAFTERHLRDFNIVAPESARPVAIAYPASTEEVSKILAYCNAHDITVVPQGGLTGMCGGAVPFRPALLMSMERMRTVEAVDADGATMTVQAGVTLDTVQKTADANNMLFPLDLGGRHAHIGGNASTNAGGNRVLRYGMMRDLILGVEAVLMDGTVISSMNRMIKNNTGYDLKHLFVGSEGTLGVITRLVLRLHPKPLSVSTALCALDSYDSAVKLLRHVKPRLGGQLSAFEVMWPEFYYTGTAALNRRPPMEPKPETGIYVLMEAMGGDPERDAEHFASVMELALEQGIVLDAVIAQSAKEARDLWSIRDCPGEFPAAGHFPQLGFDVSIPTGQIGEFAKQVHERLAAHWPKHKALYFGHIADGNLHVSIRLDENSGTEHEMDEVLYALVGEWKGSVSAEHGIGVHKRPYLHYSRSPAELALMRSIKSAMDPKGLLNPGKVI